MSRAPILRRIEACVALAASSNQGDALSAVNRARHLMRRYQVAPEELPPEVWATLKALNVFDLATASPASLAAFIRNDAKRRQRGRQRRFSRG